MPYIIIFRSTRSHQHLCAQESGTVSIPVQRLAGPPVILDLGKGNNNGSIKGSHLDVSDLHSVHVGVDSPLIQRAIARRQGSTRDVRRSSPIYRNSPAGRRRYTGSPSLNSGKHSGSESRFGSGCTGDGFRSSALQVAISRFSQQTEDEPRPRNPRSVSDGFTLSSSFEGLDKTNLEYSVQDSKMSSYDNLYSTEQPLDADSTERKQSLYDNVDDRQGRPVVAVTNRQPIEESRDDHQPSAPISHRRRKTSRTLPLRFTMFSGIQRTGHGSDDQDYVNLPMTPSPPIESRDVPEANRRPGGPVAPERKKKLRRGSKTLKLFCPRRPSVLSKIEKQVLAYVPIYGEPSSGSAGGANPLDHFQFPSPPQPTPLQPPPSHPSRLHEVAAVVEGSTKPRSPVSPFMSYANPMYCPNTSTPGDCIDMDDPFNKPNAYFSF